jgi:hypothetical protein
MQADTPSYQVFISHASTDTWVARQIAAHIRARGAVTFLDEADIQHGDDIEERIYQAAGNSRELLVLLTPWAVTRPYIWMEIGLFWGAGKRIVGVLYGLSQQELITDERIPLLLKRGKMLDINRIDGYFDELQQRVQTPERLP